MADNKALADRLFDALHSYVSPADSSYFRRALERELTREPSTPSAQAGEVFGYHFEDMDGGVWLHHGPTLPPHAQSNITTLYTTPQPQGDASPQVSGGGEVDAVLAAVREEIERATAKFPTWPTDPLHASGVVQEESGELAKAVLQAVYEPHKSTIEDVATEAFQTAAMAVRFLVSMARYDWTPGAQHRQAALSTPQARPANVSLHRQYIKQEVAKQMEPFKAHRAAKHEPAPTVDGGAPYGWIEPSTGNFVDHATKVAMPADAESFTLAVYTHPAPAPDVALAEVLYEAAGRGFHVSEMCGPDGKYHHVCKFQSLSDLHAYEDAWRAVMLAVRDATQQQGATNGQE